MSIQTNELVRRWTAPVLSLVIVGACDASTDKRVVATPTALLNGDEIPGIAWGPCEDEELHEAGVWCGTLSVPLDYDEPEGEKIELAVSKLEHSVPDEEYQGVVVVNWGGPGASGLLAATDGLYVPGDVGRAYDWIGFDPRGVGASEPSLHCIEDHLDGPRPAAVPLSEENERALLARSEAYAKACEERNGDLLEHIRTEDVVQDVDSIRAALHADKINFYGYSYGTYIGQVYATKFPDRLRRAVFDSNLDPGSIFYEANLDLAAGLQSNIEKWWTWIADNDATYHLGDSQEAVEKAFYSLQQQLYQEPVGGRFGGAELTSVAIGTAYTQDAWASTAQTWSNWLTERNPAPILELYEGVQPVENEYAALLAVACTDAIYPQSWSKIRSDVWALHKEAPLTAWPVTWYFNPCLFWTAKGSAPAEVDGVDAPAILLIGQTFDASTPVSGNLEVRRRFPRSSYLEVQGGLEHAGSLLGHECVDNTVAKYLATGELPQRRDGNRADAFCDPLPRPEPEIETYALQAQADQHFNKLKRSRAIRGRF